jgi:hypothetical protein
MKRILYILLLLTPVVLGAAPKKGPKSEIKVAVFNATASNTRSQDVSKGKAPIQRLWSNSVGAVADQIIAMDCDVVGIINVCDSIAGRKGNVGLPEALKAKGADYSWLILSNTRPSLPIEGAYNKTQAIIWKTDKYDCIDWGINWLGGYFDKNRLPKGVDGDATKSVTWAKFCEKNTGKEFYFMAASANGASNKELSLANCQNLVKIADEIVVLDGKPSIIVGSFNMQDNTPGYTEGLSTSRWVDVYNRLKADGMLMDSELKNKDTRNNAQGNKSSGGRPDYILVDGFSIEFYMVGRAKYPASDGTLVYPAYGLPVMATLTF